MDINICPICKTENKCMAHSDKPCWCNDVKVPKELLDKITEDLSGKVCICRKCIESFARK